MSAPVAPTLPVMTRVALFFRLLAVQAVDALAALVASKFGERDK